MLATLIIAAITVIAWAAYGFALICDDMTGEW